ncbi:hypothetical protein ACFRKD_26920 [Streptomyces niveus]|uniref:hypothetical protein n=1 Tax=Streptomyces niveus TaxID=193462 RepID=UPI00369F2968
MNLTDAQTAGLHLVHETGRVAARVNGGHGHWIGFGILHHRTEARLVELGLVETVILTEGKKKVPVLRLTAAGYEALGIAAPVPEEEAAAPAAEDVITLRIPRHFRTAYDEELGDTHHESDSAPYRLAWEHITTNRARAPRWLLGHLADVAAHVAQLVERAEGTDLRARFARRRSCGEILDLLHQHGARPWPLTGHGVRPLDGAAHCAECAPLIGFAAPADVLAAVAATEAERADRETAYAARLAEQLLTDESRIAAEHGDHMRVGQVVTYTDPHTGKAQPGAVQAVYYRAQGKAAADVLLVFGGCLSVLAGELAPLARPELPDMGELIEDRWLISDKNDQVLAHVSGTTREEALTAACRIPAVRDVVERDGGLVSRPLWTADLSRTP